jgi:hypothetical protein
MRKGKERRIKVNALVRLINDSLDVMEDLNHEGKLKGMKDLIALLVSWYP